MRETRLSVIGLGKLGSPMAAVFAAKGYQVVGVDINPAYDPWGLLDLTLVADIARVIPLGRDGWRALRGEAAAAAGRA